MSKWSVPVRKLPNEVFVGVQKSMDEHILGCGHDPVKFSLFTNRELLDARAKEYEREESSRSVDDSGDLFGWVCIGLTLLGIFKCWMMFG